MEKLFDAEFEPTRPFKCLQHGDLWHNNLMFRQREGGDGCQVALVDWQVLHVSSHHHDFVIFLIAIIMTNTTMRKKFVIVGTN